jgi:light-regulated signal transduction histidine kinase (bacteriophytochrome)
MSGAAGNKVRLVDTQRAILNIMEDLAGEKQQSLDTQKAFLNILADLDVEKKRVELTNRDMANEIAERKLVEADLRRATAAAEQANKELESFSYSVAHDLRAPLRSMDGFSQALLEDYETRLDEEGKMYLHRVRESAQQMARLIDDLLALSRVSREQIHREPVDLSDLARKVLDRLQNEQPDRAVEIVIAPEVPAFADLRLMAIVLGNLLGNAWKFTSRRPGARIEFGALPEEGRSVYFVRDNGAGFDMTYIGKLFGVFQRLHSPREFEGTGIGLVIVQRIIHRHGGRIWAEGAVDRGATFYFTLEEGT